jgi:hypothetical protein
MTGKNWERYKKDLPKNYAQRVQKALSAKGFSYTLQQIKDVRSMRIKDPEMQVNVWCALRRLRKSHIAKSKRVKVLQSMKA